MEASNKVKDSYREDIEQAIIYLDAVLRSMRVRKMENHPAYIELEVASDRLKQAIQRI